MNIVLCGLANLIIHELSIFICIQIIIKYERHYYMPNKTLDSLHDYRIVFYNLFLLGIF